jgi:hypothetical protein
MAGSNARLKILEMIESGEISADEGWRRLQELSDADLDDAAEIPGDEEAVIQEPTRQIDGYPAPLAPPEPPASASASPPPDFARWRRLWTIPLWIGVGFAILFAYLMAQAALAGSAFWVLCASLPFAFGVLLMIIGWSSRTARWLHLRVQQPPGETPQRIVISFPLPLRFAGWLLRIFRGRIPGTEGIDLEAMLAAVGQGTGPENPLYVEVDEGNGEKVQIYIG